MRQTMECALCLSDVKYGARVCTGCGAEISYGQPMRTMIFKFMRTWFFVGIPVVIFLLNGVGYLANMVGADIDDITIGDAISNPFGLAFIIVLLAISLAVSGFLFKKFSYRPDQIFFRRYTGR